MNRQELIAIVAAILLSGRGYRNEQEIYPDELRANMRERLAMMENEKKIAIAEAEQIVAMAELK